MKDSVNPIRPMEVSKIIRYIKDYSMSLNHPLQRRAKQWDNKRQSNLIRRILHEQEIPAINICTQTDEDGVETRYIIDGKQRCTTFMSFVNDEFKINNAVSRPIIEYTGIVYKTYESGGRTRLSRRKNKDTQQVELIPVLDENGQKQKRKQTFDIRGMKFSTLPPELQKRILDYAVPYIEVRDCTDEDIQQEIIDFNNGKPMNVEQKGVTLLGVNVVERIHEMMNSNFIKNCCNFTEKAENGSKIERRIVEALALLYGEYKGQYNLMCESLSEELTEEDIRDFSNILTDMNNIVGDNEIIHDYLGNANGKELPVVLKCYDDCRNMSYDNKAFAHFLTAWVSDLCNQKTIPDETDEGTIFESYVDYFKQSKSSKGVMDDRIREMSGRMETFLLTCEEPNSFDDIIENDTENIVEDEYNNPFEPISQFKNPLNEILYFSGREADIFSTQVLIASSELPEFRSANVDNETIRKFREYFNNSSSNEQLEIIGNAEFYTGVLYDYLNDTLVDDGFITPDNLLSLMIVIPLTNVTDRIFKEWLADFAERSLSDEIYQSITPDKTNYIMGRVNYMQTDLERYSKQYDYLNSMKVR